MGQEEIFNLKVSQGKIALAWINSYSCIVIKTSIASLVFDPVLLDPDGNFQADVIVITHEHYDHFSPILVRKLHKKTGAPILTTQFVAQRLEGIDTKILNEEEHINFKDFELYGVHCEHSANGPLSFMVSTQNGIRIYHPSDSKPFAEMVRLRKKENPDILLYSGNSLENAAQIAKLVRPRLAVSYQSDAESQRRFTSLLRKNSPTTKAKMIKLFEVYQYPC